MNQLKFYRKNTAGILIDLCDHKINHGDKIFFTVKTTPDSDKTDASALIKAEWTVGIDIAPKEDGTLELIIDSDKTDIDNTDYFYDIKLVSGDSKSSQTLITGDLTILPVATLRS